MGLGDNKLRKQQTNEEEYDRDIIEIELNNIQLGKINDADDVILTQNQPTINDANRQQAVD